MVTSDEMRCQCLIIEDNAPAAELMKLYFNKRNVLSEIAADGQIGLEMYLKDPAKYQIIFLDIQMPGMDGYEVAKRIRDSGTENATVIPIVAMSGTNTGDVLKSGDFTFFLQKPFEFRFAYEVLLESLRNNS